MTTEERLTKLEADLAELREACYAMSRLVALIAKKLELELYVEREGPKEETVN